jgi:hypothetical protein
MEATVRGAVQRRGNVAMKLVQGICGTGTKNRFRESGPYSCSFSEFYFSPWCTLIIVRLDQEGSA